jgi:hypothetical protein
MTAMQLRETDDRTAGIVNATDGALKMERPA